MYLENIDLAANWKFSVIRTRAMMMCPLKDYNSYPNWRQKISKDIDDLNSTINQLYVSYI